MKKHLPFIILCLILAIYLGLKTLPADGWSGWGIFSAQTMMSSQHWVTDGFINSKFLFIPIGSSQLVQYLDDPAMRHHARGTVTGELVGKRLYYTHYPSGYLFPYALLMKLGFEQRYWFRLLALLFSFTALILLYIFFNLISPPKLGPTIAFFATAYYALSTMFLDYADSLANQPLDDLFRALILVLSILALRIGGQTSRCHPELDSGSSANADSEQTAKNVIAIRRLAEKQSHAILGLFCRFIPRNDKTYNLLVWFSYFLLSISSYDSTFFIFIWLVGLDVVTHLSNSPSFLKGGSGRISFKSLLASLFQREGPWRKWLFFASTPVLAFVLQLLQNYWYFGNWREVWLDIVGASVARAQTGSLIKHIVDVFYTFYLATGFKTFWATLVVSALFIVCSKLKMEYLSKFTPHLLILLMAGSAYPFVFVGSGGFSYQGRQMMPFVALLVGLITAFLFFSLRDKSKINIILSAILIFSLWGGQIYRTIQYIGDWPNNKVDDQLIRLGKEVKSFAAADSTVFYVGDKLSINFLVDYYFDKPVFYFKDEKSLVSDFLWFKERVRYPFEVVIMSDQKTASDDLRQLLLKSQVSKIGETILREGEYIFKIAP